MTTGRTTPTGPAHYTMSGRSVCGGAISQLPAGDAKLCTQCERWLLRHRKSASAR